MMHRPAKGEIPSRTERPQPGQPASLVGWGRFPRQESPESHPSSLGEVPGHLAYPYLPRAQGRSYGDAGLPAPGHLAVNTAYLDRFISFDPETGLLEAESGVTFDRILKTFVPKGYFLPVTPDTAFVSLGGALASNVHGKNHHRSGSIERFVEDLEVLTPQGTFTCSTQRHADLFRATVGGYGLTGFITKARLRLRPIRSSQVTVRRLRAGSLEELFRLFALHDQAYEYSVAWLDTLAKGRSLGRGVLLLGNHAGRKGDPDGLAGVPGSKARDRGDPLALPAPHSFKVPLDLPPFFLNRAFLAAFNLAFYAWNRSSGPAPEGFRSYFYPLDSIHDWNRLYGRMGFFQYQFVIPDPGEAGIAACLDFLSRSGMGAFLSVLKRCGDDLVALPFCKRGYSLALDIPHRGEETLRLLDALDDLVVSHGGRVYLTKDARLSPSAFRAMYPEWREWMETVRRYNPEARSGSALAARLRLWD